MLNRDGWICQVVAGCPEPATVADHVIPVHDGLPDSLFFNLSNLRASCRRHNIARGFAATLDGAESRDTAVVTKDYSG